jgi:hypothetical protein
VASAAQEISDLLRVRGFVVQVGLGCVQSSYFRGLPKHISAYEIRASGQVVWGDGDILSLIPAFPADQISREDAWRLLANRMVEQLEALAGTRDPAYQTVKLFLDMATSYLVFAGRYQPSYRGRQLALESLAGEPAAKADVPFPLKSFADRIRDCTRFKLTGGDLPISYDELSRDSVRYAQLLWRWELQRLTGETGSVSDTGLMLRWMKQQPAQVRIRGWASVLRRSGWHRSWRQWPRWMQLLTLASPRYWVYGAAAELFFSRAHAGASEENWTRLVKRLPLPDETAEQLTWDAAARSVAANYRRFLETTAA